jgi:hypothetical protein
MEQIIVMLIGLNGVSWKRRRASTINELDFEIVA